MQAVLSDGQADRRSRRLTGLELLAAGLLAATVVFHVIAMVPQYYGGAGQTSLWSEPDQAAQYLVLAAGWALALGLSLIGPAQARLGAALAVGLAATEFGFRLSDLGEVFRYGSGQASVGLWLMTAAWVVGAAGAGVAVMAVHQRSQRAKAQAQSVIAPSAGHPSVTAIGYESESTVGLPELAGRSEPSTSGAGSTELRDGAEDAASPMLGAAASGGDSGAPTVGLPEPGGSGGDETSPMLGAAASGGDSAAPTVGLPELAGAAGVPTGELVGPVGFPTRELVGQVGSTESPRSPVGPLAVTSQSSTAVLEGPPFFGSASTPLEREGVGLTVLVALLALATAGAFLPAWDHYTGIATTTGRSVSFSLGNAFSGPWQVVIGTVLVAIAIVVLPILAVRMRARAAGAALAAGALIVLAAQLTAAVVQVDHHVSPSVAGLSAAQANQLGLQLHMHLTGWFTFDLLAAFALFVAVMVFGHARETQTHGSPATAWPPAPQAQRAPTFP
jgi:hypothetical protein